MSKPGGGQKVRLLAQRLAAGMAHPHADSDELDWLRASVGAHPEHSDAQTEQPDAPELFTPKHTTYTVPAETYARDVVMFVDRYVVP